ncbi:hypothetical protein [Streptomyces albidochromogenes]|uniref:Uncharacterized protein n=1 Tax=Streptomyces albidochromogenes TaxID=329524 RepID=A0ABW6FPP2_9ACTN
MPAPSPCQACGFVSLWGWIRVDGIGVLMHHSPDSERCPLAVPFDWETGNPLPVPVEAVAA